MAIQKILDNLISKLAMQTAESIESVKLFGSYARSDFSKNSDIDLLVVAKNQKDKVEDIVGDYVIDLLMDNGHYLSVKIFDKNKFDLLNQQKTFFIKHLNKDAVELWKK